MSSSLLILSGAYMNSPGKCKQGAARTHLFSPLSHHKGDGNLATLLHSLKIAPTEKKMNFP